MGQTGIHVLLSPTSSRQPVGRSLPPFPTLTLSDSGEIFNGFVQSVGRRSVVCGKLMASHVSPPLQIMHGCGIAHLPQQTLTLEPFSEITFKKFEVRFGCWLNVALLSFLPSRFSWVLFTHTSAAAL